MPESSAPVLAGRPARYVRRTITATLVVIASLAFATSFGNGWSLALQLGVEPGIAPLITPSVDLSVVALVTSIQFIRTQGFAASLVGARLFLGFCGLTTLVINIAAAASQHLYGRAAIDSVAPLLLIFWCEVAPGLVALLHQASPDERTAISQSVLDESEMSKGSSAPSAELVLRARTLDAASRAESGRRISRDRLRAALGISNALAGELVRIVRSSQDGPTL